MVILLINMNNKLLLFLAVLITTTTSQILLKQQILANLANGYVSLIADNRHYLKICQGCAGSKGDPATLQVGQGLNTRWLLRLQGDGKISLLASTGTSLARCNKCWPSSLEPDTVFAGTSLSFSASGKWTPKLLPNGKYLFIADNGKYLSRCFNCIPLGLYTNIAAVRQLNQASPQAQWQVVYLNLPKLGKVQIKGMQGSLKICSSCGGSYPSAVISSLVKDSWSQWKIIRVGAKIAFLGYNRKFLARCNNCVKIGLYPDSAFAYLQNSTSPQAQWIPVKKANGQWSFKADTGKFLSYCLGCARQSPLLSIMFVQATDNLGYQQSFTLKYI